MAIHTYVDLEIDEARFLADLVGIEYDLNTTIDWCDHFDELMSAIMSKQGTTWLVEPLTTAILVRFMRAFGGGVRFGSTKHILSYLSEEEKLHYDYFRNLRSKHVAHSVNEFEDNQVKAYYIEGSAENGINSIQTGCSRITGLSSSEIKKIRCVCHTLVAAIQSEIKDEKSKLLNITSQYTKKEIVKFKMKMPKHPSKIDVTKGRK